MFLYFRLFICCVRLFLFRLHFYNKAIWILWYSNMLKLKGILSTCVKILKKRAYCKIPFRVEVFTHPFSHFHPGMRLHPCFLRMFIREISSRDENCLRWNYPCLWWSVSYCLYVREKEKKMRKRYVNTMSMFLHIFDACSQYSFQL